MDENEKCMQAPMPDAIDKATLKRLRDEETLKLLGFRWITAAQAWGSETNYALPLLRNSEARALADSIHNFIIKGDNK